MIPTLALVSSTIADFDWTTFLVALLNIMVGGAIVALIKTRPVLKKIAADREANLLSERAEAMESMSKRIEKLEAERTIDRHRINNLTTCLDALIMLLETAPEKSAEHVARIKAIRETQILAEASEKAALISLIMGGTND